MKRNQFIKSFGISSLIIPVAVPLFSFSKPQEDPKLDKNIVEEFVRVSHGKLDVVTELLKEYPNLLNAAHDWKFGDFETGLGAASHVGNKEIAKYLISKGAQGNIFTLALFGKTDILKAMIEFSPSLLYAKGPHGLTLLHHANKGGEDALETKEYILSLGLKETQFPLY